MMIDHIARRPRRWLSNQRVLGRERRAILAAALVLLLVATSCNSGSDPAASPPIGQVDPTSTPSLEVDERATTTPDLPEPTATSSPTVVPVPTPDPLIVEAEETAVAYFLAIHQIASDARVADASEAIRLEATGGPLENYALRLINETLKSNDYINFDEIEWALVGSEVVNPNVGAVDVFICMQSSGEWRDFDTDEITKQASSEPFTFVYQVRSDGDGGSPKVWTFEDTDADGNVIPCEVPGVET